jgi:c-di-GMP-related signal transduction protein
MFYTLTHHSLLSLIFKLGFNLIVMLGRIVQKHDVHFGLVSSLKRLRNKMKDDVNFLLVLRLIDNKMWIKLLDWAGQACAKRNQNYASISISFLFCDSKTKITGFLKKCDNLTKATQLWRATFCRDNLAQAAQLQRATFFRETLFSCTPAEQHCGETCSIMLYLVVSNSLEPHA